jgi:hypothetical protein
MVSFELGPATGQVLGPRGKVDALDQLDDEPDPSEALHAYVCTESRGMVHLNMGRKKGSGFYAMATYRVIAEQPADAEMRDRDRWRAWCRAAAAPLAKPAEVLAEGRALYESWRAGETLDGIFADWLDEHGFPHAAEVRDWPTVAIKADFRILIELKQKLGMKPVPTEPAP